MALNLDRYNDKVNDWLRNSKAAMQAAALSLGIKHRQNSPSTGASVGKIKTRTRLDSGAIYMVGFRFNRSLIYTHKGAGKGRGGSTGSTWLDAYGNRKTTNPKSMGKQGTGGRIAKPWFNQVVDGPDGVDELATIAATELGHSIVNNLFIK